MYYTLIAIYIVVSLSDFQRNYLFLERHCRRDTFVRRHKEYGQVDAQVFEIYDSLLILRQVL